MTSLFDPPPKPDRSADDLLTDALAVIYQAFEVSDAGWMLPLFSGGHDSLSACYVASVHPRFDGNVYYINTTIGAKAARDFVEAVCAEQGWKLNVFQSNFSYQQFVERLGFPGPGSHQWVYNKLKDRCVSAMTKGRGKCLLVTGCRQQESVRRMGNVEPVKIGETSKKTGITRRKNRIWTAPCYNWSSADQRAFMDTYDLPRNPIKLSPLGMSGECFCGAFARPGEIELIRRYAPDVAAEIERLTQITCQTARPTTWGVRRKSEKGIIVAQTGMLCSTCDVKAAAAGLLFEEL